MACADKAEKGEVRLDFVAGLKARDMTYAIRKIMGDLPLREQLRARQVSTVWKRAVEVDVMPGWDSDIRTHHRWMAGTVHSVLNARDIESGRCTLGNGDRSSSVVAESDGRVYVLVFDWNSNIVLLAYHKRTGRLVAWANDIGSRGDAVDGLGQWRAFRVARELIVVAFWQHPMDDRDEIYVFARRDLALRTLIPGYWSEVWQKSPDELFRATFPVDGSLEARVDVLDVEECLFVPHRRLDLLTLGTTHYRNPRQPFRMGSGPWLVVQKLYESSQQLGEPRKTSYVAVNIDTGEVDRRARLYPFSKSEARNAAVPSDSRVCSAVAITDQLAVTVTLEQHDTNYDLVTHRLVFADSDGVLCKRDITELFCGDNFEWQSGWTALVEGGDDFTETCVVSYSYSRGYNNFNVLKAD